MVATRNDGHQKSRKRRCLPIFGVPRDQLNDWRALTLVAIASRKNGERAAAGRAFTYCRHLFRLLKPSVPVHCFVIAASPINHENVPPGHSYRPA
jgi:hypothetical protein